MSTIIEMPKLSDTMTVGTVVKWYKEEGEEVSNGDILAEIETDKATMELENFDDGVLLKLLANEGDEVEIGKPLAVVGSPGEDVPEFDEPDNNRVAPVEDNEEVQNEEITLPKEEPDAQSTDLNIFGQTAQTTEQPDPSGRIFASPLAKKIAQEKNIDLSKIQGSGPRGRITKKDLPSLSEPGVKDTFVLVLLRPIRCKLFLHPRYRLSLFLSVICAQSSPRGCLSPKLLSPISTYKRKLIRSSSPDQRVY